MILRVLILPFWISVTIYFRGLMYLTSCTTFVPPKLLTNLGSWRRAPYSIWAWHAHTLHSLLWISCSVLDVVTWQIVVPKLTRLYTSSVSPCLIPMVLLCFSVLLPLIDDFPFWQKEELVRLAWVCWFWAWLVLGCWMVFVCGLGFGVWLGLCFVNLVWVLAGWCFCGCGLVNLTNCSLVMFYSWFSLSIKENLPPKVEFVTALLAVNIFFYI